MTGDEEAFVVWFISAHPAKKQPIISTTIIHFALFMCFLLVISVFLLQLFDPKLKQSLLMG
jgi:hypothetical protein